jgi:hypothetical protein
MVKPLPTYARYPPASVIGLTQPYRRIGRCAAALDTVIQITFRVGYRRVIFWP